jgi:2-polyprenyl-3-methyl-5-hydroxy-6-metoxy-1,4-benzoquinol methylase
MKDIFDSYIETSFDGFKQAEFKFQQFEFNYRKYFPEDKSKDVLDIGIGRGEMLTCMKRWGHNYRGVDISPSTVRFCESLGLECEYSEDSIKWLDEKKEKYSLITCLDVLEHVPRNQAIEFLAAIRSSLCEHGKVIIQVPNLQSPFGYLHHFNDFTHVSGFVEHSLSQVLIASGFKKFQFFGFEEITSNTLKSKFKRGLRFFYRKGIKALRAINANPNPSILDPVFYVVASK